MPYIDEVITLTDDPSYSLIHYESGVVEDLHLSYGGGVSPVTVSIEERNKAGNWVSRFATPLTNTEDEYAFSILTTLPDGTQGTGEALRSLRSPYGWRLKVEGDNAGTVSFQIRLDGREED